MVVTKAELIDLLELFDEGSEIILSVDFEESPLIRVSINDQDEIVLEN